ncbi:alpha/beta fold hydrolase [Nocardia takedensis]|uniref:alpha/beta fold hydrolase n=1 Tax=Nocardia takedensis TaxID=259390 RepID=UPI0003028A5E|nr:alpha/beta hydrolase [Nocardia takedensis]
MNETQAHEPGSPPIGERVRVAGRHLFLLRAGEGGPAVVFLPGAGGVGLDYLNLHRAVAEFTTSVLYDRGGTGWSESADLPRTASEVATELRSLLAEAGVPGPYLLVGHGLGGANARRFAQVFPEDTAGFVGLEPFHEEWDAHMPADMHLDQTPAVAPGRFQTALLRVLSRPFYRKLYADWPAEVRRPLVAGHVSREWMLAGARERRNATALRAELRGGPAFPDIPAVYLAALGGDNGQRRVLTKKMLAELNDAKTALYTAAAAEVGAGEFRPVPEARHSTFHLDAPEPIVAVIRALHTRARTD